MLTGRIYRIRNYQPLDWNSYVRLHEEAARTQVEPVPSRHELKEQLQRPRYSAGKNLFVAEEGEQLVGCADVTPELDIGRVVLRCLVHPDHRRRGLASRLLSQAEKRVRELGAGLIHINVNQNNEAGKAALASLGFKYRRCYYEMRRNLVDNMGGSREVDLAGVRYRRFHSGQEEQLTRLQNRVFSGSWGFNPNTVEEIAYRLTPRGGSAKDVILAYLGGHLAGYCWINWDPHTGKGRISMFGVDPEYRGMKLGKGLLVEAISFLKRRGLQTAELTVDSNNLPAYRLYSSLGFKVWAQTLWYEKTVAR